jgi:hypothetical protein
MLTKNPIIVISLSDVLRLSGPNKGKSSFQKTSQEIEVLSRQLKFADAQPTIYLRSGKVYKGNVNLSKNTRSKKSLNADVQDWLKDCTDNSVHAIAPCILIKSQEQDLLLAICQQFRSTSYEKISIVKSKKSKRSKFYTFEIKKEWDISPILTTSV